MTDGSEEQTVPCAGGIVLGDGGAIALVRNRRETKWFFPKGHLDGGESFEEAARREIAEETGITDLEYIDYLGAYTRPRIFKDGTLADHELKDIHMYLFAAPAHAALAAAHEIEEVRWFPYRDVAASLENDQDRAWFASVFERVREAIQRD